jgi:hypothetical protein
MNQLFCEQSTNYWCLSWHYELLLSITMHPVIGYWSYLLFPHILNEWLSSISIHATIGYSPHYYWDLLGGFLEFGYPQKMHGLYWKIMTYPGKTWMICGYPQIIHVYMIFHDFSLYTMHFLGVPLFLGYHSMNTDLPVLLRVRVIRRSDGDVTPPSRAVAVPQGNSPWDLGFVYIYIHMYTYINTCNCIIYIYITYLNLQECGNVILLTWLNHLISYDIMLIMCW